MGLGEYVKTRGWMDVATRAERGCSSYTPRGFLILRIFRGIQHLTYGNRAHPFESGALAAHLQYTNERMRVLDGAGLPASPCLSIYYSLTLTVYAVHALFSEPPAFGRRLQQQRVVKCTPSANSACSVYTSKIDSVCS